LTKTILEIRDLRTYFYTYAGVVRALEGVNLRVNEGDLFGIVGETGCGKSVTALSILRLVPNPGRIIGGEIIFEGRDILKLSEEEMRREVRGKRMAATFQDPSTFLSPSHTIGEHLKDIIRANADDAERLRGGELKERIISTLTKVNLPDPERVADQYPHELSGGMRQRSMIATGTSGRPPLFIADEATTFLDVTIGAQILRLFQEMNRVDGTTIILITHNLGIIGEICNRVAVMYAGQVAETCTTEALFEKPLHPYTVGLLASIPLIERKVDELEEIPGTIPNLIHPPEGCRFHPRCKHAMEVCRREAPKMREVAEGHEVACHLFDGEVRNVE
jgi:peptide/nickel transport system ATP-binding protein